ncbi:MAG: hypothetical protein JXR76_23740 [Deltaproteobacteria bacterium]|nr:hypothetical protein [Deltaproteobacteria bacterium]
MKKGLFLVMLASMVFSGFTASAGDGKYYGGTFCQANTESAITYIRTRAWNSSTADNWLDCGVVKDTDNSVGSAYVWVVDQNPNSGKDVKCQLFCLDPNDSGWWTTEKSSSGSNPSAQQLSLGSVTCGSNTALELACFVPGSWSGNASGVAMYKVNEN